MSNESLRALLAESGALEVKSAEHPDDRRQRHRLERDALWIIWAITVFAGVIVGLNALSDRAEKRADWASGVLQVVLGGAIGFALKRPA